MLLADNPARRFPDGLSSSFLLSTDVGHCELHILPFTRMASFCLRLRTFTPFLLDLGGAFSFYYGHIAGRRHIIMAVWWDVYRTRLDYACQKTQDV